MLPTRCFVFVAALIVACFYTEDATAPILVLSVVGLHFTLLWLFPYSKARYSADCPADRNRHIVVDASFVLGALLAVAAFWESPAAIPAVVVSLIGAVLCVAETDSCKFQDPFGPYIAK